MYQVQLLGALRLTRDGHELRPGGPLQQAVLAMLALRVGRRCGPDELVDGLWGDAPPNHALGTLRNYAYRLRTVLGKDQDVLVSVQGGYLLDLPADTVDVVRFERLARDAERARSDGDLVRARRLYDEALPLWRGVPLAGVAGPHAEHQRDRLRHLHLDTRLAALRCVDDLGDHARVAADLEPLIAAHPLREDLRALRMRALYRAGRTADALAAYTEAHEVLSDELGLDPGQELSELRDRILAGGSLDEARTAQPVLPSEVPVGAVPTPRQLPPVPADLTGRAKLREAVVEALAPDEGCVPVAVLTGIGGVGKTTLALDAGHRRSADYPDGQLYAELRGAGPEPVTPDGVLLDFLLALGMPAAEIPASLAARAASYRSLLADRKVLVVLDNAASTAQIQPLLPATPGTAVLVTSRRRILPVAGARRFEVGLPPRAEALAMLSRFAGADQVAAEPEKAAELARLCGWLPLALRIVGARIAARPERGLPAMLARMTDAGRRLTELRAGDLSVEASLDLGYAALTPDQAHALRRCALLPGAGFTVPVAAALLDQPEHQAEDLLEHLVDAGLLEPHGADRFRLHDLVRLFAQRRGEVEDGADERDAALLRVGGFLLDALGQALSAPATSLAVVARLFADGRDEAGFADGAQAHAWLLAEHDLLCSTLELILKTVPAGLRQAVDALALLGISGLFEGGAHQDAVERLVDRAVDVARAAGDPTAETRALHTRAWVSYLNRDMTEAEADLRTALRRASEHRVPLIPHMSGVLLTVMLAELGRVDEAGLAFAEASRHPCGELRPVSTASTWRKLASRDGRERQACATPG
ncbi:AfsR/SARP family transcriptional regulator [Actinomadura rupiterrae]|uniref:AfsR/SARP family transcriptional regulator n=1 Tax=Actinomadura rupiterrae TaxID=559627 RepID=UPI0020A47F06|nr:BTAD domain-containing putative transcriptional regulator [Actinomadura rupiterrae]MCP2342437.1 DNA-binding SARP family transcriptional activator [Actinomadura rupiterrae]